VERDAIPFSSGGLPTPALRAAQVSAPRNNELEGFRLNGRSSMLVLNKIERSKEETLLFIIQNAATMSL
jgi:hypothetical protein